MDLISGRLAGEDIFRFEMKGETVYCVLACGSRFSGQGLVKRVIYIILSGSGSWYVSRKQFLLPAGFYLLPLIVLKGRNVLSYEAQHYGLYVDYYFAKL